MRTQTLLAAAGILAALALTAAQAPAPPAAGPVIGTCNYSPIVANLDRAIDFYDKAIGLHFDPAAPTRKFDGTTPLLDIHGVHGAQMRWAAAPLPGGRCGVELVEFGSVDRTPVESRPQDPGTATLILVVRDIAPALARAKQAGATVVSAGGEPIAFPNARGAAVLIKDPDGHYVEFLQLPPQPNAAAPEGTDNLLAWRSRIVVENSDAATKLYRELGFQVPPIEFAANKVFADLNGVMNVPVKINNADVTGGNRLELVEFQGLPHAAPRRRVQDPGATRLQLIVNDLPRAIAAVKAAGGEVVSTGGQPHALPGRGGASTPIAVARDPNNLFLVLVQR